ncbi:MULTISPECIES: hypothetical protein [Subtercola]|uniref:hypothetical protein n=1 Tax=Subtercola TaxID=120212 RepID=UPI0010AB3F8B|nr:MULTISPECIES: hypothetical protein [Subtercola]MEA9986326.1 hypothetical protein [Subtercola sp. RTI3]
MKHTSLLFRGSIALLISVSAVFCADVSSASASPQNCSGADAPPQCHHLPSAPPSVLRSSSFVPAAGVNYFDVFTFAGGTPGSTHSASGGTIWLRCSNGFSHAFKLRAGTLSGAFVSDELRTVDAEAAGSCVFETTSQISLGVSKSYLSEFFKADSGYGSPIVPSWDVQFE